jgi:hypothetical protein
MNLGCLISAKPTQQDVVRPPALPKEIVAKLHAALVTTMCTPDEYRASIWRGTAKLQEFVRKADIRPE